MSTPTASRATATPPQTLADVLVAIAAAELPERRRHDLASAVRSAARALGRPPEQVPADPRLLASRLTEIAPQALGFSKTRWSNVRSLLRAALERVTAMAPGRHLTPLSPAWQVVWDRLPSRTLKTRLSRLSHYCSAASIEPDDIGEPTFAAFREHLNHTLLKEPAAVFRETLLGWNAARAQVPGWPNIDVNIPTRRTAWTLPWSAFPESLHRDVIRYLDRLGGHDALEEVPFRPVRPLIRIGNLRTLDVERHLIRPNRAGNTLHLVIESDETKNSEPLEYPLPRSSVELIERYLSQFRPALAPAGGTALFPGGSNGCKHGNSLRAQIADAVFTHTGMRVHPHLFRHIAAKLFLDDNPGSYEVMRRVLGHRSIETTTAFYTGLETASAVRHFDQTILKLRKGGGRS